MTFSQNLEELKKIVESLEGDSLSLEESLAQFERGVQLVKACQSFLEEAKQRVHILTEDGEEEPFEDLELDEETDAESR